MGYGDCPLPIPVCFLNVYHWTLIFQPLNKQTHLSELKGTHDQRQAKVFLVLSSASPDSMPWASPVESGPSDSVWQIRRTSEDLNKYSGFPWVICSCICKAASSLPVFLSKKAWRRKTCCLFLIELSCHWATPGSVAGTFVLCALVAEPAWWA